MDSSSGKLFDSREINFLLSLTHLESNARKRLTGLGLGDNLLSAQQEPKGSSKAENLDSSSVRN